MFKDRVNNHSNSSRDLQIAMTYHDSHATITKSSHNKFLYNQNFFNVGYKHIQVTLYKQTW